MIPAHWNWGLSLAHLAGKRALVTGAGRGIGRACALALAREGADLALCARSTAELEAVAVVVHETGRRAQCIVADLSKPKACAQVVATCEGELGTIDILVNNAGVAPSAALADTTDELWDSCFAINLKAPFLLTRLLAAGMKARGYGRIVNIASTAALKGYAYTSAYVASKHALLGLTRATSRELVAHGVTVNAVCPGFADTAIAAAAVTNIVEKTGRSVAEAQKALTSEGPLKRLVKPEEVAQAVLLFCGPNSDALSGQALCVSGGAVEG